MTEKMNKRWQVKAQHDRGRDEWVRKNEGWEWKVSWCDLVKDEEIMGWAEKSVRGDQIKRWTQRDEEGWRRAEEDKLFWIVSR